MLVLEDVFFVFSLSLSLYEGAEAQPTLDKNPAPMGPEMLSSTGARAVEEGS